MTTFVFPSIDLGISAALGSCPRPSVSNLLVSELARQ